MEIFKIVAIAIIGVLIFTYLKSINSELSVLSIVATGLVLLLSVSSYIIDVLNVFSNLSSNLNIDSQIFIIVIKIIIISYIIEFTENLSNDLGATNLSAKISLCGKLIIFVTAMPIFNSLISIITTFLK